MDQSERHKLQGTQLSGGPHPSMFDVLELMRVCQILDVAEHSRPRWLDAGYFQASASHREPWLWKLVPVIFFSANKVP